MIVGGKCEREITAHAVIILRIQLSGICLYFIHIQSSYIKPERISAEHFKSRACAGQQAVVDIERLVVLSLYEGFPNKSVAQFIVIAHMLKSTVHKTVILIHLHGGDIGKQEHQAFLRFILQVQVCLQ